MNKDKNVKLIAFHLPQFHTFAENDMWWGEGFTEWTNTKKAKPLFKKHYQPKEPLNDNYYDLSKKEHIENQCKLARKYNLYGFCYYHYWFNGKLLMEKPLEILLDNKEIDINYCLCWANEPWTRAWDGKTSEILMNQDYGDKHDWVKHFQYLSKFFNDKRYIKVNNKPMMVLYRTESMLNCEEMIEYWNNSCKELGYEGIHIVEMANGFQDSAVCTNSEALIHFEPMNTIKFHRKIIDKIIVKLCSSIFNFLTQSKVQLMFYDMTWKQILAKQISDKKRKNYLGAFVDWDNTARKNRHSIIMLNGDSVKFARYLEKLCDKTFECNSEFIFINAWNEWAEGTYLEPDKVNKYSYLDSVSNVVKKYEGD